MTLTRRISLLFLALTLGTTFIGCKKDGGSSEKATNSDTPKAAAPDSVAKPTAAAAPGAARPAQGDVPPTQKLVLSSPCEAIPTASSPQGAPEVATHDLDGDGTQEAFVPMDGEESEVIKIFVRRGDCGHEVGSVNGRPRISLLETSSNGLRSITTTWDQPGGYYEAEYVFDGTRYTILRGRECTSGTCGEWDEEASDD